MLTGITDEGDSFKYKDAVNAIRPMFDSTCVVVSMGSFRWAGATDTHSLQRPRVSQEQRRPAAHFDAVGPHTTEVGAVSSQGVSRKIQDW
jgi:hypothetical protein